MKAKEKGLEYVDLIGTVSYDEVDTYYNDFVAEASTDEWIDFINEAVSKQLLFNKSRLCSTDGKDEVKVNFFYLNSLFIYYVGEDGSYEACIKASPYSLPVVKTGENGEIIGFVEDCYGFNNPVEIMLQLMMEASCLNLQVNYQVNDDFESYFTLTQKIDNQLCLLYESPTFTDTYDAAGALQLVIKEAVDFNSFPDFSQCQDTLEEFNLLDIIMRAPVVSPQKSAK